MKASAPGASSARPPSAAEYETIRGLLLSHSGITLSEAKRPMVVRRLESLLVEHALGSYAELCALLLQDRSGRALSSLVNRLSTNHSFFSREEAHFAFFTGEALPAAIAAAQRAGSRDLRIWSAGCSTGEEPYLLVMLMMERLGPAYAGWNAGALGTDISDEALAAARAGSYSFDNVRRVPRALRSRYFQELGREQWRVTEAVRREVTFRKFNLLTPAWPFQRPFHVIFCRNVMIYFDPGVKRAVAEALYRCLEPDGYLFIGLSETLRDLETGFVFVEPGIYRRPPDS